MDASSNARDAIPAPGATTASSSSLITKVDAPPIAMRRLRLPSVRRLAVISVAHVPIAIFVGWLTNAAVGICVLLAGALVGGFGFILGLVRNFRRVTATVLEPDRSSNLTGTFESFFAALLGCVVAFFWTAAYARGRQLRRDGQLVLARLAPGARWCTNVLASSLRDEIPSAVAVQWRENGRTEHASVAAFARLTLDLLALGAPPALIAASQRDGLDEIRHAELCFSLAAAIDGEAHGPDAFPELRNVPTLGTAQRRALQELAVLSLIDGALHEGVSARVLAKAARRCEFEPIRAVVKELCADEGRHAAHAWDVVEWCLAEGGSGVATALLAAARSLPEKLGSSGIAAGAAGEWEAYGVPSHALEASEYLATRAAAIARVERLVEGSSDTRTPSVSGTGQFSFSITRSRTRPPSRTAPARL